jgi:hypothetical protein
VFTIGDYTVIADVGKTMLQLLRDHMIPEPILQPEFIGLSSPVDKGDLNLSLFLYNIKENGDNRTNQMLSKGAGKLQFPPMSVDLFYLITAHSTAELHSRSLDENQILGKAIQVLYDNSVLRNSVLQGTLAENNEEVRIVMDVLPMDIMVSLFPNIPYKLSVSYMVGPVNIDSMRVKSTKRVLESDMSIKG